MVTVVDRLGRDGDDAFRRVRRHTFARVATDAESGLGGAIRNTGATWANEGRPSAIEANPDT